MNKELLDTFVHFAKNTSVEVLSRGIRRMLFTTLITDSDIGLSDDLNGKFFETLESLFDLLDELNSANLQRFRKDAKKQKDDL